MIKCTDCDACVAGTSPTCHRHAPTPCTTTHVHSDGHWVDWPILKDLAGCAEGIPKDSAKPDAR